MRAAQRIMVADVADLAHGQARAFVFEDGGYEGRGFVMMLREPVGSSEASESADEGERGDVVEELVAYRNRCAHVAFDLDMGTGEFWSAKLGRIYCRTHGACYEPRTGICDRGPCVGKALEKLAVERQGRDAVVSIPSESPDRER